MATFILVHGTWAKSAHWPILQDGLAEAARAAGDKPVFEQLMWTGRNWARDRRAAASAIFTLVQRVQRAAANEKIFIIGHSHGGSAIAYFLKEYPEAAKTLGGCAFLSTPFVAIRPRREAYQLISALILFLYIPFASLWKAITEERPDHPTMEKITERLNAPIITSADLFAIFVAGVVAALVWWASVSLKKASAAQNVELAIRQQTADIPAGNYLFLRCSGDEAAAALSAAQIVAWAATKTSQMLELLTRPLYNSGRPYVQAVSWALFSLLLSSFGYGWFAVFPGIYKSGFGYFLSPDGLLFEKLDIISMIFHITKIVYAFVSFVVACFLSLCILAALFVFAVQALTSWIFGWTLLSTGFLVEVAIEPLPFGEHSLGHIDWTAGSIGLDGLLHSWTYAHPVAIMHLQKWVMERLEELSKTAAEPKTVECIPPTSD
jgi:pimeloyl-ACP methyl ester carboxylesterase